MWIRHTSAHVQMICHFFNTYNRKEMAQAQGIIFALLSDTKYVGNRAGASWSCITHVILANLPVL